MGMPSKTTSFTDAATNPRRPSSEYFRRGSCDLKSRKNFNVTINLDSTIAKTNSESVYTFVGNRQATDLLKNASSYLSGVLSTSRKP